MRYRLAAALALAGLAVLASACSGTGETEKASAAPAAGRACPKAWRGGWQRLADRIGAPVYCPSWLPSPLTGHIGGPGTIVDSVSRDRSYLVGFAWKEREDEVHVNLRGYPGSTAVPHCRQVDIKAGKQVVKSVPCFAEAHGRRHAGGIEATVYTVNQDADRWHVAYVWRYQGSLYVLSEHVAPPFTYATVGRNLDRMLRSLVLVEPRST